MNKDLFHLSTRFSTEKAPQSLKIRFLHTEKVNITVDKSENF